MTTERTDVVIVGSGTTGLSAAYELAKAGVGVIVVDRGILGGQAAARNPGCVRLLGRHPHEVPLMIAAMERWHGLAKELDQDLEFRETGILWIALSDKEMTDLTKMRDRDAGFGIDVRVLNRQEMKSFAPELSDAVVGGVLSPTSCNANTFRVAFGYYNAARRHGARFRFGTEVVDILRNGSRVTGVVTTDGEIEASTVVLAAGVWSAAIGRMVGVDLPLTASPYQSIITEPVPRFLPPAYVLGSSVQFMQFHTGQLYIGNMVDPPNDAGESWGYTQATDCDELRRTVASLAKIVPCVRRLNFTRTWVGTIDCTPDDNTIFGRPEGVDGLVLACGFSGHGFALAPIMGQLLRELIVDGKTTLPVDAFRLSRFDSGVVEDSGTHWAPSRGIRETHG